MSEAGDTITSGTDMDCPGSPLGPGYPGAPIGKCDDSYNKCLGDGLLLQSATDVLS